MMNAINFQQIYNVFAPLSYNKGSSSNPTRANDVVMSEANNNNNNCKSNNNGQCFFTSLSYDSVLAVLSFLSVHDLGRLAQVSREARLYAEDDYVWRGLCKALEPRWMDALKRPAHMVPRVYARPSEWKRMYHIEIQRISICSRFVGMWSEKWCDVNVQHSTMIESDGRSWTVHYKKNKFSASFREYDPVSDVLTFQLEGGDSGWSFIYKIKPTPGNDNHCSLTVFRVHDNKTFTGEFLRTAPSEAPRQLDNAMGTHLE
eukprot:TRINITY_DN319_c0_g1_i2.p1 TRINITY_DN319_c0_g1~~TRINITY_DN319_c0_g1_i2.p1  ORF type:complete len:259 (-),score=53.47 TRINITY_DN319_c0_g1_i2:90-866(-)